MAAIKGETIGVKIENDDFYKRCRVCMKKKMDLSSAFDGKSSHTVEELEFCTGILMTKEDGLPISICGDCKRTLTIAYEFKNLCLKSDQLLRKLLQLKHLNKISVKKEVQSDNYSDCKVIEEVKAEPITFKQDDDDDNDGYVEDFTFFDECKSKQRRPKAQVKIEKKTKAKNRRDVLKPEIKVKEFTCEHCNLKFADKDSMLMHKRNVHGFDWICEVCGKQFMHRSSHLSHIRSHLPPRYKCDSCDYKTWHKADMKKHCKIHTGTKDYVCEYCTRSFHTVSNLHDHIRRNHTTRKQIKCPRCDRVFYASDKLRRHIDTHDNIKRFQCELCHSQYSRRCQWKQHLLKQHNILVPKQRPGRRKENFVLSSYLQRTDVFIENPEKSEYFVKNPEKSDVFIENPEKSEVLMKNSEKSDVFIENPEKTDIFIGNPEKSDVYLGDPNKTTIL